MTNVSSYVVMTALKKEIDCTIQDYRGIEAVIYFLKENFALYERTKGKEGISRFNKNLVKLLKHGYQSLSEIEWQKLKKTIIQNGWIDSFAFCKSEFNVELSQYAETFEKELKNGNVKTVNNYRAAKEKIFDELRQSFFYNEPLKPTEFDKDNNGFNLGIFEEYKDVSKAIKEKTRSGKILKNQIYLVKRPATKEVVNRFLKYGSTFRIESDKAKISDYKNVVFEYFK